MPFITSKVSVSISKAQEAELKTRLGQAIELVSGKSEEYLLLEFVDNCRLWLRGRNDEPVVYIEAAIFSNNFHYGYDGFTLEITRIFSETLQIKPENIYVKYEDITAWGGQGNVHRQQQIRVNIMEQQIVLTAFTDPIIGMGVPKEN